MSCSMPKVTMVPPGATGGAWAIGGDGGGGVCLSALDANPRRPLLHDAVFVVPQDDDGAEDVVDLLGEAVEAADPLDVGG